MGNNDNKYVLQEGSVITIAFEGDGDYELEVLKIFQVERLTYAAVMPVGTNDLWFYEYEEHQGAYELLDIEDDELYELVGKYYDMAAEAEEPPEAEYEPVIEVEKPPVKLLVKQTKERREGLFGRPDEYVFYYDYAPKDKIYRATCDSDDVRVYDGRDKAVGRIAVTRGFASKRKFWLSEGKKNLGEVTEKAIVRHKYNVDYRNMKLEGNAFSSKCTLKDETGKVFMTAKSEWPSWSIERNAEISEVETILLFLIQMIPFDDDNDYDYER